jgi:hypothetical protein
MLVWAIVSHPSTRNFSLCRALLPLVWPKRPAQSRGDRAGLVMSLWARCVEPKERRLPAEPPCSRQNAHFQVTELGSFCPRDNFASTMVPSAGAGDRPWHLLSCFPITDQRPERTLPHSPGLACGQGPKILCGSLIRIGCWPV